MPLPLSTLTMESIAVIVEKWRKSELTSRQAIAEIEKKIISLQKIEWADSH